MPGDATFTVRRYSCARAACGDDLIIYDVGNFSSHVQFTCVHYCDSVVLSEAVVWKCVYLALTPLSTCHRGLGISTSVQQFLLASFLYEIKNFNVM